MSTKKAVWIQSAACRGNNQSTAMQKTINLEGKGVRVELTDSAEHAIDNLRGILVAEIHLIFSCLIVKRVWFNETADTNMETVPISGNLHAGFRVVRYAKSCRISHIDNGDEQPSDFPLARDKSAFVPHWLRIDFSKGNWIGSYGYNRDIASETRDILDVNLSLGRQAI